MINEYINYLNQAKGASPLTCLAYRKDLQSFAQWAKAQDNGITWRTVTKGFIEAYRNYLEEEGKAIATVKRHISCLRGFYRWMQTAMGESENPAKFVETPKAKKLLPETLTKADIIAAIGKADKRTKALITLLYETGVRISEALNITTGDVNKQDCSIRIYGKGAKERIVYYGKATREALNDYAKGRKGYVFVGLSQREARKNIAAAFSNSEAKASPHRLRHSFATAMVTNGADLNTVRLLLGHENLNTTQVYLHTALPTIHDIYTATSPLA